LTTENTEYTEVLGLIFHFLTANQTNLANFSWLANSTFTIQNSPFKRSASFTIQAQRLSGISQQQPCALPQLTLKNRSTTY